MDPDIYELAQTCITRFSQKGMMISTAESCTGGLIAGALTEIAGSSAVLDRGFVTYSNEAKVDMLKVDASLIEHHGAVSGEVAGAMAIGAQSLSKADFSVAVTGIAGPGGGSAKKPVGLVFIAVATNQNKVVVSEHRFADFGRKSIREETIFNALTLLLDQLDA